jgi:hypothetical protein
VCFHRRTSERGAVLLEVVLALVLFVSAATVITGGLSASVDEVERLRLGVHADNLAATILSEMQMGMVPVEAGGPVAFDAPFDQWTWQAVAEPVMDPVGGTNTLQKVEVIVRHQSQPIVCRLTQFLPESTGPLNQKDTSGAQTDASSGAAVGGSTSSGGVAN